MKKQFFIILLISFFLFAACSNNQNKNLIKEDMSQLKIGILPSLDAIPMIIAKENGYFEDEGLIVIIEKFKSAIDRDTALQTHNLDGAMSDMLSLVFFNDNGFEVKMTSKTDGSFKLLTSPKSTIKTLENISGNTIGISSNTIIEYLTDRISYKYNLNENVLKKISIPKMPIRLEMLQNEKIDLATLPEPLASIAIKNGSRILTSSEELGINPAIIMFSESAINNKPKEISAFYRAYNKAVEYINDEKLDNFIDVIVEKGDFPLAVKTSLVLPNYLEATMPDEVEFVEVLKWLKSRGLTKGNYSYNDLKNDTFIK